MPMEQSKTTTGEIGNPNVGGLNQPKQPTISDSIEALEREVSRAGMLAGRLSELADRLCGSGPQEAQDGDERSDKPRSVLSQLLSDRESLAENLSEIENQINRIDGVL